MIRELVLYSDFKAFLISSCICFLFYWVDREHVFMCCFVIEKKTCFCASFLNDSFC